ncbi:MAG TPA: double zinc ribbon domain-containing protein [Anaerolineales bacterium]
MNNIPWSYRIRRLAWSGIDLLFPPVCAGCGKVTSQRCSDCQARVPRINKPFCERCGIPDSQVATCEKCKLNPPMYRVMRSWAVFDSPVQNALHTLKYRRNIGIGDALARQMTGFVRSLNLDVEMLIPVPLGKKRLRERGYNQVALVARPLAYELGLQYAPHGLWKSRETRSQVGLNISQRRENVSQAYQADDKVVKRNPSC